MLSFSPNGNALYRTMNLTISHNPFHVIIRFIASDWMEKKPTLAAYGSITSISPI
jgi:hypothetical protein